MERCIITLVVNNITIAKVRWRRVMDLYIVSNTFLVKKSWNLQSKPMIFFILSYIVLRCYSKFCFRSKNIPRCLCNATWIGWFKSDTTQKYFLTSMMHDITYTRAVPNVITCMMNNITWTRALLNMYVCMYAYIYLTSVKFTWIIRNK